MEEKKKVRLGWKEWLLLSFSILFVFFVMGIIDDIIEFPADYYTPQNISLIFPRGSSEEFVSTDFHYWVSINSIGIRDKEITLPKDKNVYRIAVLGDSYTYGWGVNITDTWVRHLESQLQVKGKKVETVNLGKPGADPIYHLELAKVAIPIIEPDLIIIALLQGDDLLAVCGSEFQKSKEDFIYKMLTYMFPNISRKVRKYFTQRYLTKQGQGKPALFTTAEENQESARISAKEIVSQFNEKEKERFNKLDKEIRNAFLNGLINPFLISVAVKSPEVTTVPLEDSSNPAIAPCIEKLTSILKEIKSIGKQVGAETVAVSIPQSFYVNQPAWENIKRLQFTVSPEMLTSENIDKHFILSAEKASVPCFILTPEFRQQKNNPNLFFPIDGHPTPEGHKLIANVLSNQLQRWLEKQ